MLIIAVLTALPIIVIILDLFNLHNISLSEEKITLKFLISRKKVDIMYKDIISTESHHQKYSGKSFNLTKGYFIREYHLADGRILMLSPDTFENYEDLVNTINKHTSNLK